MPVLEAALVVSANIVTMQRVMGNNVHFEVAFADNLIRPAIACGFFSPNSLLKP
jgi:hypothetical protein